MDMSGMMEILPSPLSIGAKPACKDMMAVLLELTIVKDPNHRGPDGKTLQGRMQRLIKTITRDITGCGNVCDAYAKKGIVGMLF
jgi:hypothetical protein